MAKPRGQARRVRVAERQIDPDHSEQEGEAPGDRVDSPHRGASPAPPTRREHGRPEQGQSQRERAYIGVVAPGRQLVPRLLTQPIEFAHEEEVVREKVGEAVALLANASSR